MNKIWTIAAVAGAMLAIPAASFAHGLPKNATLHGHHMTKSHKADAPSSPITTTGKVSSTSGALQLKTSSGTTYTLRFGPPWYTTTSPLAKTVGQTITVSGSASSHTIQVHTLNGKTLRGHGKPPWAGVKGKGHKGQGKG